jgi:hypothetical protein
METGVRPVWLIWGVLALTVAGAYCFLRGWLGAGLGLLLLSLPLDLVASRLAVLRLRPLAVHLLSRRAIWAVSGLALLALGWWEMRHVSGWGALLSALTAIGFAEAGRIEKAVFPPDADLWLFSRRSAVILAVPFAIAGAWTAYLVGLLAYAALSFFIVQHVRHRASS